jgi:hypothetical protein
MDSTERKKRAAMMAVMAFLEEEARCGKKSNNWVNQGREVIMRNRHIVQGKSLR